MAVPDVDDSAGRRPADRSTASAGPMPIRLSEAMLRPLKTSEIIARDIVGDIARHRLATGTSLPSEAAMLQLYGVSRESLREGLRLLEAQGLISLRRGPGGGPVVGSVDPANLGRIATLYYHLAGATYAELTEAWVVAEGLMAELAARNPDRRLVRAAMAPYVAGSPPHRTAPGMEEAEAGGETIEEFIRIHSEFHLTIGALADNKVLQLSLMSISEITAHHVVLNADPRQARERIETDHRAIAKAVSAGHHLTAKRLSTDHLRAITDLYRGALGPQMDDLVEWR